jgi:hypothetical protein
MITEDYVSFETAKLLKEKGFDEPCQFLYSSKYKPEGDFVGNFNARKNSEINEASCSAPTLQMAMKWLREVYNLVIEPYRTACGYLYTISSVPYGSTMYDNSQEFNGDDEDSGQWTTWEKACEDGIKYCIENLI